MRSLHRPILRQPTIALFAMVVAIVLGAMSTTAAASVEGTAHSLGPNAGARDAALLGVSADSTTDAWAVGDATNPSGAARTITFHWNGASWTKVPSPNPGGTTSPGELNELTGVAAVSPSDVWAVGFYARGESDSPHGLILHWGGTSWSRVPSPCTGAVTCFLFGVSADSSTDVWAVGETTGKRAESLILHWDGTSWTRTPSPEPAILHGVSADSPSDAWAVGTWEKPGTEAILTVALRWDGTAWTRVRPPNPGGKGVDALNLLNGVSTVSASDAWAVGSFKMVGQNRARRTLVLRWDGTRWRKIQSPNPGGRSTGSVSELNAVSAVSGSDAWAVGDYDNANNGAVKTLILHWDGGTWTKVPSPNPSGTTFPAVNRLFGVSADTSADAWAVGDRLAKSSHYAGTFLRWNGVTWTSA